MKVKVLLNNVALVIPVAAPKERIARLMSDIAHRFESFGVKPGELRISELRAGEFFLNPRDIIEEVVNDNEVLIALDYDAWLAKEEKNCKTDKLEVLREDYEDEVPKWAVVGIHELNKLYIKLGNGWPGGKAKKLLRLEIFDVDALQYFSKDGQVLIASKEAEDKKWAIEAYFIVERGICKEVRVSVKSSSDIKPTIKALPIKIAKHKITLGDVVVVQENVVTYDPTKYSVPKPIESGPVLTIAPEEKETPVEIKSVATGKCSLEAVYKGLFEPDQGWERDGKFPNSFNLNLTLTNRSTEVLAISKVTVEYLNASKEWASVDSVFLGDRRRYYDYSYPTDALHFKIGEKSTREMAIRAIVQINASTFTARRRAHKSFPQPLKFRVTFIDLDNDTSTIEFETKNAPLDLPIKDKIFTDNKMKETFFIQCDDTELEGRIYVAVGWTDDGYFALRHNDGSVYVNFSTLISYAYQGVKTKSKEVEFTELAPRLHAKCSTKGYMLIDLENGICYGMKLLLQTTTSKAEGCFVFPVIAKK